MDGSTLESEADCDPAGSLAPIILRGAVPPGQRHADGGARGAMDAQAPIRRRLTQGDASQVRGKSDEGLLALQMLVEEVDRSLHGNRERL